MDLDLQRQLSRFKRLPQRDDTWEGAIVAMPAWVDGKDGADPYRPEGAVWVSTSVQVVHATRLGEPGTVNEAAAVAAVLEMGTSGKLAGFRPRRLRVRDESLATVLRRTIEGLDIEVEVTPELRALDEILEVMARGISGDASPSALDAPGVTVQRLRQFAEAAKQFFDAAPWKHLDDEDLFRVEKPKPPFGLGRFTVMGSAELQFGLAFFSSVDRYNALKHAARPEAVLQETPESVLFFSPAWETTFADLSVWERLGLPLASSRAYPTALCAGGPSGPERPDSDELAYLEGLLRALAMTSEDELDTGRWSRTVETAGGPVEYVLTLPNLLAAKEESGLDALPASAMTPLEQAQDLIAEAAEAAGRWQLQLIRRALALSADCADAYALLAQRSSTSAGERALWEQAVAAGERELGPAAFEDPGREFWVDHATRPYMQARMSLAECLFDQGETDAAGAHFRALLTLNPADNQGARFRLLEWLLVTDRNAEAAALVEDQDEPLAVWPYASVLLALRGGEPRRARAALSAALRVNRHIPKYLTGQRELPEVGPVFYVPGGDDEAAIFAMRLIGPWSQTPKAIAWLRAEMRRRR